MDLRKLLEKAGVEPDRIDEAIASIESAKPRTEGLLWHKIKGRLFKAKELASYIPWEGERLLDYRPDLKDYDVAPMINIPGHGDNPPWVMTPQGLRPAPGMWMNKDPESEEYKKAVASNYWCKGAHPRSPESRRAWYKRNAGEFLAYRLGETVDFDRDGPPKIYVKDGIKVVNSGKVWFIRVKTKIIGRFNWQTRLGYEIDNLWSESQNVQGWYPIPGYELKAPVTNSSIPSFKA